MNNNKRTVVEYINKNNQMVQVVVNTDSLIDARREVAKRSNVKKIVNARPATPMDEI